MSPSSSSTKRVLFVEDAFDQALLVKSFLGSVEGFHVVHAQDGDQAVALLKSQEWDLLITDLNLPGTDGFDVIRASRELHPTVPILATTGHTRPAYAEGAVRAGANEVLRKPLDRDEFLQQVGLLVEISDRNRKKSGSATSGILAVSGLTGDAEMGCGGVLMEARHEGRPVLILPLVRQQDQGAQSRSGARAAAGLLGAEVLIQEAAMETTERRTGLLRLALTQVEPDTLYVPARGDTDPARQEASRLAISVAGDSVRRIYGYQTATTGLDFQPTVFEDVRDGMVLKMEALASYQAAGAGRLDLAPKMAQAYARYWGRFRNFGEVEAFEVIKDEG